MIPAIKAAPMMDLAELVRVVGGAAYGPSVRFAGVSTDSRSVSASDLFVALKGERFDGHDFVAQALGRGALAALTSRRVSGAAAPSQVVVPDTRLALGHLAADWRRRFALPLVGLTGSNGKTTVKEMLAAILAAHCGERACVLATQGNLNNDIGVPLTLLRLREQHRFAVVEMGMNHAGEIEHLARLARPSVAIVTNAQRAHVGMLGSVEAIARAKAEIYAGLEASGIAVVNADDAFAPYWRRLNAKRQTVTFGLGEGADVRAKRSGSELRFITPADTFVVTLQVAGEHNVRNALAACAAAHALAIPARAMRAGLATFSGVPGRLQRRRLVGGGTLIDDSYNANPESMQAAIEVLAAERARKVLVIGDMGELGAEAGSMHAEVGAFARAASIDALLALGVSSRLAAEAFGQGAQHFDDVEALLAAARGEAERGATILVKGSRFMHMERVVDALAQGGTDAL